MLEGSIAFTLSGATNSKFKALFSVWLPDYYTQVAIGLSLHFYIVIYVPVACDLLRESGSKGEH